MTLWSVSLFISLYALTVLNYPRGGAITFKRKNTLANHKPEEKRKWDFIGEIATTTVVQRKVESNVWTDSEVDSHLECKVVSM